MFGGQNIGTVNPFQQLGAVSPFQQLGAVSPFQQLGAVHPIQQAAQQAAAVLSGRCPTCGTPTNVSRIFQQPTAGISPLSAVLGGVTPQPFLTGGFGSHPLASALAQTVGGISPFLNPPFGGAEFGGQLGMGQINPLTQPFSGVGPFGGQLAGQLGRAGGQWGESAIPGLGPLAQQAFGGVNPLLAQVLANPAIASHPIVAALIAQQLNPLAAQQPPIRSLIGPQPYIPFQQGEVGGYGAVTGQGIDPYSALVQAQLMSQLPGHPLQQLLRAYTGSPWTMGAGLSALTGQNLPFGQTAGPFGI